MSIAGIGGQPGQMIERAQRAADSIGQQAQEFENVMAQVQQQGGDPGKLVQQAADAQLTPGAKAGEIRVEGIRAPAEADGLYAKTMEAARGPDGPAKLLADIEQGYGRLNELIGEIQGGKTYSPQQLLGMQGEMHSITLQLETATKVMTELVSGVKQLMQQQV